MAKGQVVRGTPVTHIGPSGAASIAPGKPADMNGTTPQGYSSESKGYRDTEFPNRGTEYQSDAGNPGDASRTAEGTGRYGMVLSENGQDHNNPASNGRGVILDRADDYNTGYGPQDKPTMDSPVPRDAPVFDAGFIRTEDRAHMGRGSDAEGTASDDLMKVGGVMSR
jgi:hypothetical protein